MQLAAGAGRRNRHLPRPDPASPVDRQLDARRHQAVEPVRPRQGAPTSSSTSPITVTSMPASGRSAVGTCTSRTYHFRDAVPSDPPVPLGNRVFRCDAGQIWVPMDDYNCMVYNWMYSTSDCAVDRGGPAPSAGIGNGPDFCRPEDLRDRSRTVSNNYGIDREVQRTKGYTGIDGINQQDRAVAREPWGASSARREEHLGPADKAIGQARIIVAPGGQDSRGGRHAYGTGTSCYEIRGHGEEVLARDADSTRSWRPTSPRRKSSEQTEARPAPTPTLPARGGGSLVLSAKDPPRERGGRHPRPRRGRAGAAATERLTDRGGGRLLARSPHFCSIRGATAWRRSPSPGVLVPV